MHEKEVEKGGAGRTKAWEEKHGRLVLSYRGEEELGPRKEAPQKRGRQPSYTRRRGSYVGGGKAGAELGSTFPSAAVLHRSMRKKIPTGMGGRALP